MVSTIKTDYFWTDIEQAQERLTGSVVLYDGQPVVIQEITRGDPDPEKNRHGTPKARILECGKPNADTSRKILSSAKFNQFRDMPNLGWFNPAGYPAVGACFCTRRTVTTRTHGLINTNTIVSSFNHNGGETTLQDGQQFQFSNIYHDKGWLDAHNGKFPSLDAILVNIAENSAIAYSRRYAVLRDGIGIRWLYRNKDRVGLFAGVDTLMLLTKFVYLREEIMGDDGFTLNNIRDF